MRKKYIAACTICCFLFLSVPAEPQAESGPKFDQPVLITSAGQSAEVQMASVLAKRAELDFTLSKMATAQELEGIRSVCLVIGVSLKGLGAAGLDMAQEKERITSLLEAAKEKNIPVLCLHLGGEQRRGQQSDSMIKEFLPYARMAMIVKSGNQDGLFNSICDPKGILLVEVEKTVDILGPLKEAFD
jgi:hypothetical protein